LLKVLIADDEAGIRLLIRKLVEKNKGFEVVGEAADGESAVSLTESLNPDVIFMDVEMDLAIKTGRIDGRLAMELLLMDMD
jgi:two-component system LytT family response regulator